MENSPVTAGAQARFGRAALLEKLSRTILLAGFFALLFSVQGAGFFVIFALIPQAILIPIRLYMAIRKRASWQLNLARAIVWLVALTAVFSAHAVRAEINRKNADEILARIDAYHASHGTCAARIEDAGIGMEELRDKLGYSYYHCEEGKQHFFYRASFMPFSSWHYDFEQSNWHYVSD